MPLVMQSLTRHIKGGLPFSVSAEAQAMLTSYPWPGNVRELENVVQRAVVLCGGRVVTPAHVMFDDAGLDDQAGYASQMENLVQTMPAVTYPQPSYAQPSYAQPIYAQGASSAPIEIRSTETPVNLEHAVMVSEQQVIMAAIQSTDSRMEAAAKLGISPRTLRYKLAQLRSRGMSEGATA
jgi:two-component system response regulator FlrC